MMMSRWSEFPNELDFFSRVFMKYFSSKNENTFTVDKSSQSDCSSASADGFFLSFKLHAASYKRKSFRKLVQV